jgi:glutathione S-transferase
MKMKLYHFPFAPNPAKVLIYLSEKGISLDTQVVNLPQGEQRKPEFLALNPMGKLPVLELDDGTRLTESLPILEYLEELHPEPPLIGTTPEERAHVRNLERLCDVGVLQSVARLVHATRSPLGLPPNPGVAEQARESLAQSLRVLDAAIGDGPFVAGERVTIADCTLRAALRFGGFFEIEVDPAFANVIRWHERFQKRPSANPV